MRALFPILLVTSLPLLGCGGGSGGGDGPASTLSGWYAFSRSPAYVEAYTAELEESGDSLYLAGEEFTREGEGWVHYDPAPYSPDRRQSTLHVVADGHLEGSTRRLSAGVLVDSSEFRLLSAPRPEGLTTYTGSVNGQPFGGDDAPSHAMDETWPGNYAVAINAFRSRAGLQIELHFLQDPPLTAQTYTVGSSTLQGGLILSGPGIVASTTGSVILTHWDPDRMAGTWYFETASGDECAGTFDVPITIHK